MKTMFTIPHESLAVLERYSKLIEKVADVTNRQFFRVTDKRLDVYVTGRHSILTFFVDIDGFISDNDSDFVAMNYKKFIATAGQIASVDALSVTVEDGGLRLLLKSVASKSKVTLSCFDTASEAEVNSVTDEYDLIYKEYFEPGEVSVKLSSGLMEFARVSSKFMKLTTKSNAILVEGNSAKYADNTAVITYLDGENLVTGADKMTVHNLVIDMIDAIPSEDKSVVQEVQYSKNGEFVKFESNSTDALKFIINVQAPQFDFPSKDEEATIIPEPGKSVVVKVGRAAFLDSITLFNGIFESALWRWKSLTLAYSNDSPNQVLLSHSDSNAEAERTCELLDATNATESNDVSFVFSSEFCKSVLEFGQGLFVAKNGKDSAVDDVITIEFSDASFDEEHGVGVVMESSDGSLRAIFSKLTD